MRRILAIFVLVAIVFIPQPASAEGAMECGDGQMMTLHITPDELEPNTFECMPLDQSLLDSYAGWCYPDQLTVPTFSYNGEVQEWGADPACITLETEYECDYGFVMRDGVCQEEIQEPQLPPTEEVLNDEALGQETETPVPTEVPSGFGSVYVNTGDGSGLNCRVDPVNGNMDILTTIPYGEVVYWMSGGGGDNPWARVAWTSYDCFVDVGYLSWEIPSPIETAEPATEPEVVETTTIEVVTDQPESSSAEPVNQIEVNSADEDETIQVSQSPIHGPVNTEAESNSVYVAPNGLPSTGVGTAYSLAGGKVELPDDSGQQPSITPQQRDAVITFLVLIAVAGIGFAACRRDWRH